MEIYIACDVCGHRYVLPDERMGRNAKCKSCGVSFTVNSENFYDPDTSETDEEEDEEETSSIGQAWDIVKKVGHALAGLVTVAMLFWMSTLLFRSPQDARAQVAQGSGNSNSTNSQKPQPFRPNLTPSLPQPQPQPNALPAPQVTIPKPPVTDGSIGWPDAQPGRPAPSPFPDYVVGQPVQVFKDGRWVPAIIRQIESNGNVKVRFIGRPRSEMESFSRDRVRKQ